VVFIELDKWIGAFSRSRSGRLGSLRSSLDELQYFKNQLTVKRLKLTVGVCFRCRRVIPIVRELSSGG
jgi:hypothetical protein